MNMSEQNKFLKVVSSVSEKLGEVNINDLRKESLHMESKIALKQLILSL
jgi:hypothetical protein